MPVMHELIRKSVFSNPNELSPPVGGTTPDSRDNTGHIPLLGGLAQLPRRRRSEKGWATGLAVVTWIPVLRGDPRLHSHASRRRPAEPVPTQVPKAAKLVVGGARRSGCCHCHLMIFPDVLSRMRHEHYPTDNTHPGVARPHHQGHHRGGLVVVLVLFKAAGLMPRVASDRSASATAYGHRTTMKMIASHPRGRVISVHPGGMTMLIRQG